MFRLWQYNMSFLNSSAKLLPVCRPRHDQMDHNRYPGYVIFPDLSTLKHIENTLTPLSEILTRGPFHPCGSKVQGVLTDIESFAEAHGTYSLYELTSYARNNALSSQAGIQEVPLQYLKGKSVIGLIRKAHHMIGRQSMFNLPPNLSVQTQQDRFAAGIAMVKRIGEMMNGFEKTWMQFYPALNDLVHEHLGA